MICKCEMCSALPEYTYTQAYRLKCEAELIWSWPLIKRREYADKLPMNRRIELRKEMERIKNDR